MPGDEPRPVSGFGNLRVKVWLATHRSISQPSHVLHRLSTPRHPPGTLSNLTTFLSRTLARELFQVSVIRSDHIPEVVKDRLRPRRCGPRLRGRSILRGAPEGPVRDRRLRTRPVDGTRRLTPFSVLPHAWWRRQGSNLRPPACKAGALPLSYAPAIARWPGAWWAYVDSNHRPYAYQAYALTT